MLEELTGNEAGTVAFGTEAAQLTELGAEGCGLGSGRHSRRAPDGRVCARRLNSKPVLNILRNAIQRLCT